MALTQIEPFGVNSANSFTFANVTATSNVNAANINATTIGNTGTAVKGTSGGGGAGSTIAGSTIAGAAAAGSGVTGANDLTGMSVPTQYMGFGNGGGLNVAGTIPGGGGGAGSATGTNPSGAGGRVRIIFLRMMHALKTLFF